MSLKLKKNLKILKKNYKRNIFLITSVKDIKKREYFKKKRYKNIIFKKINY